MASYSIELTVSGAEKIEKRLKSISGERILDVCTAKGGFIDTLMKFLKDYDSFVGIDISEEELEHARKRFEKQPKIEIKEMNADVLEFEDNSFDTVCISHSLHHLDHIDKVLTEMKRVLKKNGYFILQEMYCDGEQTEAQKSDILQHHWDSEIDTLMGILHYNTFPRQRLREIFGSLGLKHVDVFESIHPINCLICEKRKECEDPRNEKIINQAIKEIDDGLKRLEEHLNIIAVDQYSKVEKLKDEAEKLKEVMPLFEQLKTMLAESGSV